MAFQRWQNGKFRVQARRSGLLTLLVAGGALVFGGCGSDGGAACEDGWYREFVCGRDGAGKQPQQCVGGQWYSTSFCALPDGSVHPDGPNYDPSKPIPGVNNQQGDADTGTGTDTGGNDTEVPRPTNPDGCIILKNTDVNGGKRLTSDDCYVAESQLTVNEGTLEIEAGTSILFRKDADLTIRDEGRLRAIGEPGKRIWFYGTNDEKGFWGGLIFRDTGSGENALDYVQIKGAGSKGQGGVYVHGGNVNLTVSNSIFEKNATAGIQADHGDSYVRIESSEFKDGELALRLHPEHFRLLGDDLEFSGNQDTDGNAKDYVFVSGTNNLTVTKNGTWPGYTYYSRGNIEITGAIKISEGATLILEKERHVNVKGDSASLIAEGTAEKPIVFTGSAKRRGSWRGIQIASTNSPDTLLKHVRIEYAGDSVYVLSQERGALFIKGEDIEVTLDNVTFHDNQHAGVKTDRNSIKLDTSNLTFTKNEVPVMLYASQIGSLQEGTVFEDNDTQAIQVRGGDVTSAAEWVRHSVPYEALSIISVSAALTLQTGSTYIFGTQTGFDVKTTGSLTAVADSGSRITMQGKQDIPGVWRGLRFGSRNAQNKLDGVDILNAGDSAWVLSTSQAGLFLSSDSRVEVNNVKITGSRKFGVRVDGNAELVGCSGLDLSNNEEANFSGITGVSDCK